MVELSIIIPIYNTEREILKRCLDSVCGIIAIKFECLLIDDGSCEEVGAFCRTYIQGDSRFVYVWKENGGVSSARNMGLRIASGDYVCFVDSDDTILPEMYNTPGLLDNTYDLIFSDYCEISRSRKTRWSAFDEPGEISYETAIKRMIHYGKLNGPFCKLIGRTFLMEHSIFFSETMFQGEDAVYLYELLKKKPKMLYCDAVSYDYYFVYSNDNQRYVKAPVLSVANVMQHYNASVECIKQGCFSESEKEELLSKKKNSCIVELFGRALDSLEYKILNKELQCTIQKAVVMVMATGPRELGVEQKIKIAALRSKNWLFLKVLVYIRMIYYKIKGLR